MLINFCMKNNNDPEHFLDADARYGYSLVFLLLAIVSCFAQKYKFILFNHFLRRFHRMPFF